MDHILSTVVRAVRGMVTPHGHIRLSRCCSHVPEIFFREILVGGNTTSERVCLLAPHSRILSVRSRRNLIVSHDPVEWNSLLDRRFTRARQFVKVLIDEAYVFGYKGFSESELRFVFIRWLILDWMGHSIKQMKLHTVWLSGYSRGVDAPTTGMFDKPGFLMTVHYRQWLMRKMRIERTPTCAYAHSASEVIGETLLLGTKRGCPSMENEDVEEQCDVYLNQMSEEHDISGPFREHIIAALRETAAEVLGNFVDSVPVRSYVPSVNAGFEAPRDLGGILRKCVEKGDYLGERVAIADAWDGSEHTELSGRPYNYVDSWNDALEEWVDRKEPADCQVYMIREPLKLRTITAGSPTLYGNCQPILDHMRAGMRRFECFRLTRQENNAAWLSTRLNCLPDSAPIKHPSGRYDLPVDFEAQWRLINSGDYQQSTNDLSMEATTIVRNEAFTGKLGWMVRKALGIQILHGVNGKAAEQANGQLMGSPLSFPVLCIINAALMRLAYQLAYNRWWGKGLDQFPMAVNGDDIVSRLDLRVYDVWVQLLRAVNWKLSPGKSYLHESLAQVNSQTMRVTFVRGKVLLEEPIPFVNSGFMQQMKKSCSQIDESPLDQMSFDWQKRWNSLDKLPHGMRVRAREVFKANLAANCRRLYEQGWTPFLLVPTNPVGLGGLGINDGSPLDLEAAWLGLHSLKTKTPSYSEKERRDVGYVKIEEPYFRLRPCAKRGVGDLLDAQVDDLERYVRELERVELLAPVGHVDPEIKRSTLTEHVVGARVRWLPFESHCDHARVGVSVLGSR